MTKIRWGVLSTANIGVAKVLPAMQRGALCDVTAIASRDLAKAQATAKQLGIPKAYGSYEELLADPEIDAIYNPLPNHLHVPWSIKAIEAGKHVLCEKPIALTTAEAQTAASVRQPTSGRPSRPDPSVRARRPSSRSAWRSPSGAIRSAASSAARSWKS